MRESICDNSLKMGYKMRQKIASFHIFGLNVVVERSTPLVFLGLVVVFTGVTSALGLSLIEALLAGLVLADLHYVGSFWHHLGHAFLARRAGYPMAGITYWGLLGRSEYPSDEGDVPPSAHIQRALGGALFSSLACVVLLALIILHNGTFLLLHLVLVIAFLENVLVYTVGALFPPVRISGFSNDGATIVYWRGKLKA